MSKSSWSGLEFKELLWKDLKLEPNLWEDRTASTQHADGNSEDHFLSQYCEVDALVSGRKRGPQFK